MSRLSATSGDDDLMAAYIEEITKEGKSPEAAEDKTDVSGRTVRRWMDEPKKRPAKMQSNTRTAVIDYLRRRGRITSPDVDATRPSLENRATSWDALAELLHAIERDGPEAVLRRLLHWRDNRAPR